METLLFGDVIFAEELTSVAKAKLVREVEITVFVGLTMFDPGAKFLLETARHPKVIRQVVGRSGGNVQERREAIRKLR